MPRRARKAQCYLLDLPQALGSTRWLNPRELLSLQTLPHGSLNCHVVSVSPLLSAATALFKGKFEECCGFFVERRHFEMCKMSWENGSCGALGESRPFPSNSYPLHFSTSVALLAHPSVWAGSIPLKSLYIPYKPQRRRKTLNVLSVLLDWEVKILALQGWPSCRPAPPVRCQDVLMPCANGQPHPPVLCHHHHLSTSLSPDPIWSSAYPDCRYSSTKAVTLWVQTGALASGKSRFLWNVWCIWDQMLWCKIMVIEKPAGWGKQEMTAQVKVVLEHRDNDHSICDSFGLSCV